MTRFMACGLLACALAVAVAGSHSTLLASSPRASVTAPLPPSAEGVSPATVISYSAIVDRVQPGVVTVQVEKREAAGAVPAQGRLRDFFGPQARTAPREGRVSGLGSGVVIRADGYILTNHHVIVDADRIRVELSDGRTLAASVIGSDTASDLAVLKVEGHDLPTVPFGDSGRVKVGDVVLAFGNPFGVGQTVTMGIVSAKGRATDIGEGSYEDFLQTDAPINQGNSGGALVSVKGELVGINAQIMSPSGGNIGLGFAIPSSMARAVADQLIAEGVVHRSKLGIVVQPMTADLAEGLGVPDARGALVSAVEPGGPAADAGLQPGDVITRIDGQMISEANALRNQIASTRPGSAVALTVIRGGRTETISARLVERERVGAQSARAEGPAESGPASFGMALAPLTPDVAEQLDLARTETGLAVMGVDPGGAAAAAGILPGDVIKRVNGRDVGSMPTLRAALAERQDKPALVLVNRQGSSLFVALPHVQS